MLIDLYLRKTFKNLKKYKRNNLFVSFGHCDFRIGFLVALFSIQISFQLP